MSEVTIDGFLQHNIDSDVNIALMITWLPCESLFNDHNQQYREFNLGRVRIHVLTL